MRLSSSLSRSKLFVNSKIQQRNNVLSIRRSIFALIALIALVIPRLRLIENILDCKFLIYCNLPFCIYKRILIQRNGGLLPPRRELEIRDNCSGIESIYMAQHPILFKQCLVTNTTVDDFLLFKDSRQNIFPHCEGEKMFRYFEFESYDGKKKKIVEDVPCDSSTLSQKLESFDKYNLVASNNNNASADNGYFEVHTYMMSQRERQLMQTNIKRLMVTPSQDLGITQKMLVPVMTFFLHAGRSAVYYLHAHPDHFLSFCLSEEKTWLLIDPLYSDSFDSIWSGNAQVILRELDPHVPRLIVKQKRGDLLYVPPWWLHETLVKRTAKNIGFNIHFGVRGQLTMELLNLFRFDPQFFYSWVKQIKPEKFKVDKRNSTDEKVDMYDG